MKPKIVFLDEYSLAGRDLSAVKALGDYTGYDMTAPDEVAVRCADAEIVVTNKVQLDAATIAQLPHLRLICVAATGVNNIDLDAAAEHGVEVRNAAGYSTHSVAETTLGAAIAIKKGCKNAARRSPCCANRSTTTNFSRAAVTPARRACSVSTVRSGSCTGAVGVSSGWVRSAVKWRGWLRLSAAR